MKIDNIILYNFGSYEGETVFETYTNENERNIILVGGKNGAGKTTLFTAMRLCLYGHMSMGYKNNNSFYTRAIIKLLNNTAKMSRPVNAYVSMQISLSNGHEIDTYILKREWLLKETLGETFIVYKNGMLLSSFEVADFEKYLLALIPPELFNLYFFDGEKIADFFLEEGGNARMKEAFLTLCGYDTFEIMRRNFKRLSHGQVNSETCLDEYLEAKDAVLEAQETQKALERKLQQCNDEFDACEAELVSSEKEYRQKGGVTQEEWNQKLFILKEEEKKRETYNAILKKWANEMVPFLIVRDQIVKLNIQIDKEINAQKYRNFCEVIEMPAIATLLRGNVVKAKSIAQKAFGDIDNNILDLSLEQSAFLIAQINQILEFDPDKIIKYKKAVKGSLRKTATIRQELENSSVANVQEYMMNRARLLELKSALLVQRIELEKQIVISKENLSQLENQFSRVQAHLEDDLKKASINDISTRAIVMLDKLQQTLYRHQIEKVEAFFRDEIKILMRKSRFIDDIRIDDDFNTHIYRKDTFEVDSLLNAFHTNTEMQLNAMLGKAALEELKRIANTTQWDKVCEFYNAYAERSIVLPIEIDKMTLSKGEKQIFIMALYHSLIQLCKHEIPFVIDTPFARIDTEHRRNISKHFFCKLKGQVFILSTNEEINSKHVQIMNDKISATYMLENTDNTRTVVMSNKYFEV